MSMNTRDLLRTRIQLQRLDEPVFKTPADTVRYFGAVQAQDYLGSLWAVGQRTSDSTESSVEAALADRSIVRSWPMRGTIHYTVPGDLRWMLDLLGDRIIKKSMYNRLQAGVTKNDLVKGQKVVEKEMAGGKILERSEVYEIFKRARIKTDNSRGLHIIGHLALNKVLCFGPRSGKQPTFVLLDDWIPEKKILTKEESMAELATRYFTSHGPATVHDFAWWSGLTVTEAGRALSMIESKIQKVVVDGADYWMRQDVVLNDKLTNNVRLLPAYDEFLVSYKDRSAAETSAITRLRDRESIFTSVVIVNGQVGAVWKRTVNNKGVSFKFKKYEKFNKQSEAGLNKQMKRYAKFIGAKLLS
jgi:hypothetical protein